MPIKPLVIVAATGGAAVAAAIGVNVFLWQDEVKVAPTPAPPATQTTASQAPAKDAAPPVPAEIRPSFDVVRVDPGGDAVMAGRARPGSTVIILDNAKPIGEVIADSRGEWVFVPTTPLAPGSRELTLKMRLADDTTVDSDDVVVLAVPESGKDIAGRASEGTSGALVLLTPRSGGASTVLQRPSDQASSGQASPGQASPGQASPGQASPGQASPGKASLGQASSGQASSGKASLGKASSGKASSGKASTRLSVEIIDYDDDGRLVISGRAGPGSWVNVYLDNALIGRAEAGAGGVWRLSPEAGIKPGLYSLRADQIDAANKVMARVSMPFSRATPVADPPPEPLVIVQPGNSLWRLARRTYGKGTRYTIIFQANKEQIKDPDLIYPGQVFALPATN